MNYEDVIHDFEEKHPNTKVIFCVEIGSRGRNLDIEDSDYDIGIIFVPKLNKLYSNNRGNLSYQYKYDDVTDVTVHDLQKITSFFIKHKYAYAEWLYSNKVYYNHDYVITDLLKELYKKHYNRNKLINHYAGLGNKGGERHGRIKFRRVLWCYLIVRGATNISDAFEFDYMKFNGLLNHILIEDKHVISKKYEKLDEIVRKYYNTNKEFQMEDFLKFKTFFENQINYENINKNKFNKKEIIKDYNKVLEIGGKIAIQ